MPKNSSAGKDETEQKWAVNPLAPGDAPAKERKASLGGSSGGGSAKERKSSQGGSSGGLPTWSELSPATPSRAAILSTKRPNYFLSVGESFCETELPAQLKEKGVSKEEWEEGLKGYRVATASNPAFAPFCCCCLIMPVIFGPCYCIMKGQAEAREALWLYNFNKMLETHGCYARLMLRRAKFDLPPLQPPPDYASAGDKVKHKLKELEIKVRGPERNKPCLFLVVATTPEEIEKLKAEPSELPPVKDDRFIELPPLKKADGLVEEEPDTLVSRLSRKNSKPLASSEATTGAAK